MKFLRENSFRRYALGADILAALATLLFVLGAGWLTLQELNRQYLDARVTQAAGIPLFLEEHIVRARQLLLQYKAELLEDPAHMALHLEQFSEIYRVDAQLRIAEIYKAPPTTHVFPGFSLARTELAAYLQTLGDKDTHSQILRGYGDGVPTIYIFIRLNNNGDLLLGALDLVYIQRFLQRYSAYSGNPIYMLRGDGFVMFAAGSPPGVAAFDVQQLSATPTKQHILHLGARSWIPVAAETGTAGIKLVTLLPADPLYEQRDTFLIFLGLFLIWLLVALSLRNMYTNRFIFKPMAAFISKLRALQPGQGVSERECTDCRFTEFAEMHDTFVRMADALQEHAQQLMLVNAQLEVLAVTDGLTKLANRRHFDGILEIELARLQRHGGRLSLLMLDVDYFKLFNDNYGHTAGDECLRRVAEVLSGALNRPSDLAARYGGEEFALILPDTDAQGALEIAERVRVEVEQLAIPHHRSRTADYVTVSIGAVTVRPRVGDSVEALVALADGQLYTAKHDGRNRVQCLDAAGCSAETTARIDARHDRQNATLG